MLRKLLIAQVLLVIVLVGMARLLERRTHALQQELAALQARQQEQVQALATQAVAAFAAHRHAAAWPAATAALRMANVPGAGVDAAALRQQLHVAAREEFAWLLAEVATGRSGPAQVESFLARCADTLPATSFAALWAAERPRYAERRAAQAGRWLLVEVEGADPALAAALYAGLEARWRNRFGYSLALGPAMSPAEAGAAWKTLRVTVRQTPARYRDDQGGHHELPWRVDVSFALVGDASIATSWDALPPLAAATEPAPGLTGRAEELPSWQAASQQELADHLTAALSAVPEFALFPGVDPATLTFADAEGRLQPAAARALLLLAPDLAKRQLAELLGTPQLMLRHELARLILRLRLNGYHEQVLAILRAADPPRQEELLALLCEQPACGDFAPLLYLLEQGDGELPLQTLQALRPHLAAAPVAAVLARLAADPGYPFRVALLKVWLHDMPPESLAGQTALVRDADLAVAQVALQVLARRAPELAHRAACAALPTAPPGLQVPLGQALRPPETPALPPELVEALELFVGPPPASPREVSPPARTQAWEKLRGWATHPGAWQLLREALKYAPVSAPEQAMPSHLALAAAAPTAVTEQAVTYLADELVAAQETLARLPAEDNARAGWLELREKALQALLARPGSRTPALARLAAVVAARTEDYDLLGALARALHQYAQPNTDWDWRPPEAAALLAAIANHPLPEVRRLGYVLQHEALRQGIAPYRQALQLARQREPDTDLQALLEEMLRP
jgi:hypothetical protein